MNFFNPYDTCKKAKWFFLFFLAGTALSVKAQVVREPSKIPVDPFYFMQRLGPVVLRSAPDSSNLIGMFSTKGTKVLPFSFYNIMNYPLNEPITDNLIFLLVSNMQRYQKAGFEVLSGFETKPNAFLRNGLNMYEPYWYDNGVDYFKEGRQRFVYDNKIGFVNRLGQVTVWAHYSYAEPYRNGYALACTDCVYTVLDSSDKEHCCGFKGNKWVVINKEGKEIKRLRVIQGERLEAQIPHTKQSLSALEKTLAAKLLALPEIKIFADDMQVSMKERNMVLYDKPFKHSPYYHFGLQSVDDTFSGNDYHFLISPDGQTILHINNTLQKIKTLKDWRKELQPATNK
jgi:hypothetical protein